MAFQIGGPRDLWSDIIADDQNFEEEKEGVNRKLPVAVVYGRRRVESENNNEVELERGRACRENRVSLAAPKRISWKKTLSIRGRESIVVGAGFDIKPQLRQKAQQKKPKQGPRSNKTLPQPDFRKEKAYFEEVDSFELVEESPSPKHFWKMTENHDIIYHDLPAILERWKISKIALSCSRPIYKIMATPAVPSISSSNTNSSTLIEKKPERRLDNNGMLDKRCIISSFDSLRIKDENESFDGFNALENGNIIRGIDGGIVKEESLDIQSTSFSGECLSAFTQLLMVCKQATPVRLSEVFSTYCDPSSIRKIGEGTYGEAFRAGQTVCKVVPIDGDSLVNGEIQKRSEEVLEEVLLSLTLNNLREQKGEAGVYNSCTNFIETKDFRICQGVYDSSLISAWEEWDAIHGSENDHPKGFSEKQCYIVFVLADGGKDLESFVLSNYDEARSLIVQATAALAVAETACEFEHRDLHWGNILLSRGETCMLEFTLEGKKRSIKTFGLNISIIDFTLSRINTGEAILFLDLSQDPELFEGPKRDRQAETYRQMRKITGDCWEGSFPKTNVLWLTYLVDILLTKKSFARTSKDEKELRLFKKHLRSYSSAKECLSDSFFNGVLDVCEPEPLSI